MQYNMAHMMVMRMVGLVDPKTMELRYDVFKILLEDAIGFEADVMDVSVFHCK